MWCLRRNDVLPRLNAWPRIACAGTLFFDPSTSGGRFRLCRSALPLQEDGRDDSRGHPVAQGGAGEAMTCKDEDAGAGGTGRGWVARFSLPGPGELFLAFLGVGDRKSTRLNSSH